MNINTDNYEAYLLDYQEGNLNESEARQLKEFVLAQGLDWDELTEELPKLGVPNLVYENKEALKKRSKKVPLFVQIASIAAALALLFVVFWKQDDTMPKQELIATLKPIAAHTLETETYASTVPSKKTYQFNNQSVKSNRVEKTETMERENMPLVAEMQPIATKTLELSGSAVREIQPNLPLPLYLLNDYYAYMDYSDYDDASEYSEEKPSLIDKGIVWLSDGRYNGFGHFINSALHRAKQDVMETTTKVAMTAYYKIDYEIEEAKERWQEKWEQKEEE